MKTRHLRGLLSIPRIIVIIGAGTLALSLLFFVFWQRLTQKVEDILKEQFNQQQLELARKIADNVESYFDFLEAELLGFPSRVQLMSLDSPVFDRYMESRFQDLHLLGILEIRLLDEEGRLRRCWRGPGVSAREAGEELSPAQRTWLNNPKNVGRLYLSKVHRAKSPPWQGRLIMSLLTALPPTSPGRPHGGALELVINPLFIAEMVTRGVRSGQTGYAWIIDQNGIFLAHHEHEFVGEDALEVRRRRNPQLTYFGLEELQVKLLRGEEGTGMYVSGWHRHKVAEIPKLAAYTPVRFNKGLIRDTTDIEDADQNLWGVAVVAPVEEVAGQVAAVTRQELILVGFFLLAIILVPIALIIMAVSWNKVLAKEVQLKTEELMESQKRLLRSERFAAVGEAAAYVSHEIKNPLMVIGGLARQVQRKVEDHPDLREKLGIIQAEVQRLENFLGEIRDFTRPTPPAKQEIDLNAVIQEIHRFLEAEATRRGIQMEVRLDPGLPRIQADPNQMKQVLLNLIKNSFEAMDSGGRILISSGRKDQEIWFSVMDTGKGMGPEVLEKIFNPFFTTKPRGTGLGLAVINKIINDHQGSIAVESTPGRGTTITVRLPLGDGQTA